MTARLAVIVDFLETALWAGIYTGHCFPAPAAIAFDHFSVVGD